MLADTRPCSWPSRTFTWLFVPVAFLVALIFRLIAVGQGLHQHLILLRAFASLAPVFVILIVAHSIVESISNHSSSEISENPDKERGVSHLALTPLLRANPLPTCLATLDEGRVVAVNDAWVRLFGYSGEEAAGRTSLDLDLWVQPAQRAVLLRQLRASGSVQDFEHQIRTKGGDVRDVLVATQVVEVNGTRYALSLVHDVTERRRAEEATRRQFERLITNISTEFINLESDQIDSGIERALGAIGQFIASDRSYVMLFSADGKRVDKIHEWCRPGAASHPSRPRNQPVEDLPVLISQLKQGQVVTIPSEDHFSKGQAEQERTRPHAASTPSLLLVPLVCRGQVVGQLGFDSVRAKTAWSEDSLALLRIAGEIIVNALEHKRASEALRKLVQDITEQKLAAQKLAEANQSLEQRVAAHTHALATLNAIAAHVGSSLNLNEIMAHALERMMELTDMEHGLAYRVAGGEDGTTDAEPARLHVMAWRGFPPDFADLGDGILLSASAAGVAARQGEPMIWSLAELPTVSTIKERLASQRVQQVIAIPLMAKGRIVGSLNLSTNQSHTFLPEQLALLKTIGQQVGGAVENARLYEQVERSAQVAERSRLARELHDSITQSLYSMTLYAESAARMFTRGRQEEAVGRLRDLSNTAQEALREMRLLIFELHPPALERGLAAALQARLESVEARCGVHAALQVEGKEALTGPLQAELYRIALEALNNVLKHAGAQSVHVHLVQDRAMVHLQIRDDGSGFDTATLSKRGGFGISGMRERARRIGGTLEITSTPGQGTSVIVQVPIRTRDSEDRAP